MTQKTFSRYENKYILTQAQYAALLAVLPQFMRPDDYNVGAGYPIFNLYFDTPGDDIIRHSLSKPYFKEKLRLRSYRVLDSDQDNVFLELKGKIGGIVFKRRSKMTLAQAMTFTETAVPPLINGYLNCQVSQEIAGFLHRYTVSPKVYISYHRQAYFGKEDKEFRVTFDQELTARRQDLCLCSESYGDPLLPQDKVLMEVKIIGAMPLWLAHNLSRLGIYSTSFSKYGTAYKNFMERNQSLCLTPFSQLLLHRH